MTHDERVDAIEAKWQAEHARSPKMAKSTFVTNRLFGFPGISELCAWLMRDPALHGQVFRSSSIGGTSESMTSKPDPEREGWRLHWIDQNKPHYRVEIAVEIVKDGESKLQPRREAYDWSCCDD